MLGNPYYLGNTSLIPNSDIPIPKTVQSLGLRQIQGFEMVDSFIYSSDLMDSKVSKLYALCKTQQTTDTAQIEQQNVQQEHIEDINLDAVLKQ